jgi:hypothetical protein
MLLPQWISRLGGGRTSHRDDPYWDFFINQPPADLANTVIDMIRNAPEGNIFPKKTELHTPEITSSHVKGMAQYFGAELVGVAKLNPGEDAEGHPFAVICAVHAENGARNWRPSAGPKRFFYQLRAQRLDQGVGLPRDCNSRCARRKLGRKGRPRQTERGRQTGHGEIRHKGSRGERNTNGLAPGTGRIAFGISNLEI